MIIRGDRNGRTIVDPGNLSGRKNAWSSHLDINSGSWNKKRRGSKTLSFSTPAKNLLPGYPVKSGQIWNGRTIYETCLYLSQQTGSPQTDECAGAFSPFAKTLRLT